MGVKLVAWSSKGDNRQRKYRWQELPQVSFLSQQAHVCCDKTHLLLQQKYTCCDKTFVVTKIWCCNKTFAVTKICCCNKSFVATNICHDKYNFVVTEVLLCQAYFCRNKRCVLSWQPQVCCDKSMLVTTKVLTWQNYVCCDCNKACVCCNKTFVTTKTILVAAPTNDKEELQWLSEALKAPMKINSLEGSIKRRKRSLKSPVKP